ncbi:MAG: NmrA family NAD(P)-binding protein [Nocardioides sp.]
MTDVLIAGATGMLGSRVAHHLTNEPAVRQGGQLSLLVRPGSLADEAKRTTIEALVADGAVVVDGDLNDHDSLVHATKSVDVVISAVQGGKDVLVDGQVALARASQHNGVRRLVASDFAIDLFKAPAAAPMFATRREAAEILDGLDLEVLHILTGGFLDLMLNPGYPGFVDAERSSVTYWGDGTEPFDMTTVEDTARLTARLALDDTATATTTGGVHQFSATTTTMQQIADELEQTTGRTFTRHSLGSLDDLRTAIEHEQDPYAAMGLWYQLAIATTPPFDAADNARYADIELTTLRDHIRSSYR